MTERLSDERLAELIRERDALPPYRADDWTAEQLARLLARDQAVLRAADADHAELVEAVRALRLPVIVALPAFWECWHCRATAETRRSTMRHASDCPGVRLAALLEDAT